MGIFFAVNCEEKITLSHTDRLVHVRFLAHSTKYKYPTLPAPTFLFVLSSFRGIFFLQSELCRAKDRPLRSLSS